MLYEVRALRGNTLERLEIEASSSEDVMRLVTAQRLVFVEATPKRGSALPVRPSRFDLTLFSQELLELLDAGLAVVEAVDALATRKGPASALHSVLLSRLRQGFAFSAALEQLPEYFPALYIGLIRAAEKTSDLQGALSRFIEYRGRFDALKSRISSALIYPAILLSVGGTVTLFLLGFVVPRFASVYRGTGRELPLLSQWLLNWGSFASDHALAVATTVGTLLAAAVAWVLFAIRSGRLETVLTAFPMVRDRVATFRIARLYLTVGTLLNGGMPVIQALTLADGVIPSSMRGQLSSAREDLKRGEAISAALERHALTTEVSGRLLRVGEGTGKMGDLMIRAARYHDNELARWLERFTKLFEPLLMAAIGLIIGTIVVLLYMPVFDLASGFQ
jgi:general secretion pathway protein F